MKNYQIIIGYKAVITVDVKAENEKEAKEKGLNMFTKAKDKIYNSKNIYLQDDNFKADGCIDMDATYNMYGKD